MRARLARLGPRRGETRRRRTWFVSVRPVPLKGLPPRLRCPGCSPPPRTGGPPPRPPSAARHARRRAMLAALALGDLRDPRALRPSDRTAVRRSGRRARRATRLLPPPPPQGWRSRGTVGSRCLSRERARRHRSRLPRRRERRARTSTRSAARRTRAATRVAHRIFGGGGAAGSSTTSSAAAQGPSTGRLNVGAAPGDRRLLAGGRHDRRPPRLRRQRQEVRLRDRHPAGRRAVGRRLGHAPAGGPGADRRLDDRREHVARSAGGRPLAGRAARRSRATPRTPGTTSAVVHPATVPLAPHRCAFSSSPTSSARPGAARSRSDSRAARGARRRLLRGQRRERRRRARADPEARRPAPRRGRRRGHARQPRVGPRRARPVPRRLRRVVRPANVATARRDARSRSCRRLTGRRWRSST